MKPAPKTRPSPKAAMSNPRLPPEILDYTIDLLHDEPGALKQCCLVSKSWVPRTRRHLFARIDFDSTHELEAWKRSFPDPTNSPAYHTLSLFVGCPHFFTVADAIEGGWLRAFSRVVELNLYTHFRRRYGSEFSLAPFHNFSPVLKSLRVTSSIICPRVFNLFCSLPLLEDLTIHEFRGGVADHDEIDLQPTTSAPLTGTFKFFVNETGPTVRRLLNLPGGLRFRKLVLNWREEDLRWITALVTGCSDTLECLDVERTVHSMFLRFLLLDQHLT